MDIPIKETEGNHEIYTTMPFGMIVVRDDFIITVSLKELDIIKEFETGKVKGFATYMKKQI